MERFSPNIEIKNHFDDLVQQIDMDIEESLEKHKKNKAFGKLECFQVKNRNIVKDDSNFKIEFFESSDENKEKTMDLWSESTKVVYYLKQIRMRIIEKLRKEQKETVQNSSRFNSFNAKLTKEEKRSQLFAEKFYFQVKITNPDIISWVFNLFTFVTDFYMSQSNIDLLQ